ncbi:hypothetical protein K5V21_06195 [Clostridium sardiniense]|uniref:Phage protein n=1 Tax=Clostridium sardiniense TaxID=29369 RepID=A0ABS7KWE5_CLOSR|nr:hypothetical protein [Clostridium sardiniense]MBY0755044.1 hypothetical protein [Clostridium sardiniense]MDQ0459101.1 hypothetical protein [Clostridium sardiniense]
MKYDVLTECTCCNDKTLCSEEVIEVDGVQEVLHFCEFCDKEIQDILDYYNN